MEVEGVTVKLVGARLGARRKVSTWMMKPTIYLLYIVRALQIVRRKHKRKKERALNTKKNKQTTTTTRAQQLLSMLGTENITKDTFFLIWIMKLTETEIYVLFTINIVRGPRDCGKNKERKLFLQKMCFPQSLTYI